MIMFDAKVLLTNNVSALKEYCNSLTAYSDSKQGK